MKWNNDQLEAIYTTNKDIVVSASAGAGKTAILVERLLTLCTRDKDPIDLDKIVAMTFTEAASSEMKKRLSQSLNKKLQEPNSNKTLINKQLILLDTAQISTIHAFCLNIIKKYYDVINLDPSMIDNTLDEITVLNIQQKAFNNSYLNYSKDNNLLNLINNFSIKIFSIEELQNIVFQIIKTANSVFDSEKWYLKARSNYKLINSINDINTDILDLYYQSLLDNMLDYKNILNPLITSLKSNTKIKEILLNNTIKINYHVDKCIEYLNNKNYEDFINEHKKINNLNYRALKYNDYEKGLKKYFFNTYKSLNSKLYDCKTVVSINNNLHVLANQLIDLAILTNQEIVNLKEKISGFDFDDMEKYAYKILTSNNNMIANQLKQEYDEILIDEFQDTNEIQNEIVKLISKGNNTFRVGDVKQSIYRFRKAKPAIMRDLMNDTDYKLISLKNNYRSKENIVAFTNSLFSKLMNIEGFNDKYLEIDTVNIGLDSQKDYKENTINFYALKNDKSLQLDNNQLKAMFIANKIKEMVSSNNYKYKDFVILTRGHNEKNYLVEAFDNLNIPYFIDTKSGFYSSWMSYIIISYLKLVIDINDQISLMAVLTSPIYNMSDEQCALLVLNNKSLLKGIINSNHEILNDINNLKEIYRLKGISAMLDYISLLNNFVSEKCDIQQRTNFDLFYETALAFEKNSLNLNDFIKQIESIKDDKNSEAISVGEDEDVVRAMTIHHSKGLQFKVVFFWSTTIFKDQDSSNKVLSDSEIGFGIDYIDTKYYAKYNSIQKEAIKFQIKNESTQEFIRLLYVALTRAQEELYIIDTYKNEFELQNLTQYYARKNTTGTKLIGYILENSELFKVEYIDKFNFKYEPSNIIKSNTKLPYYNDILLDNIEVITPSKDSHELTLDIDLNRNKDALIRGSLMHEYIEKLPDRLWDDKDISKIINLNENDKNSLILFNKSKLFDKCLSMTIYHEYPFILKQNNTLINGIIDLLAINNNEIIIIDFKSDKNITEKKLKELYTQQIMHYVDSLQNIYPDKAIKAYIYSFTLNKEIEVI
ncbi:MAG: UvrD-helicase domain-containing protein [Erysipelotrichaceae bacterium]|nr:UvrD-helicase domain-containing protein [Erysipelotrichaceae bacterium]